MLLVKKDVFMPTTEQKIIFGYMGYAAYKLWNVGNYEKLNYKKLGMTAFPNWYDQKTGTTKRNVLKIISFIRIFPAKLHKMYFNSFKRHGSVSLRLKRQVVS